MTAKIFTIALTTFRESMRSKILYSVLVFAVLVCAAASAFGKVTIGEQGVVVENFGLFSTSLFSLAFALISGSVLFAKELSKRTIFTILARPVRRLEIIIGKWLGMVVTAGFLITLMASALAVYVSFIFQLNSAPIFSAAFFILTELMIVCALVMLFSSIVVTPLLIGVFSLGVFLAGRSASYILQFIDSNSAEALVTPILRVFHMLLPKLELFAVSDRLVDGVVLDTQYYLSGFGYALGYSLVTLIVASGIFQLREFN